MDRDPSRITPAFDASIVTLSTKISGNCDETAMRVGEEDGNTAGSKSIVVPARTFCRQARSVPAPLSPALVTVQRPALSNLGGGVSTRGGAFAGKVGGRTARGNSRRLGIEFRIGGGEPRFAAMKPPSES